MNSYALLELVWQTGTACESCPHLVGRSESNEVWGSVYSASRNACRVIEDDMEPTECPGLEAAKERIEEDERLYG